MSIRAETKGVKEIIGAVDEDTWNEFPYTPDGESEVVETINHSRRFVTRRTCRLKNKPRRSPAWCYFGFLTDLGVTTTEVHQFQRNRAVIEFYIRHVDDSSSQHLSSGNFSADKVWLVFSVIARNLLRWSALLGEITTEGTFLALRRMRFKLVSIGA